MRTYWMRTEGAETCKRKWKGGDGQTDRQTDRQTKGGKGVSVVDWLAGLGNSLGLRACGLIVIFHL